MEQAKVKKMIVFGAIEKVIVYSKAKAISFDDIWLFAKAVAVVIVIILVVAGHFS